MIPKKALSSSGLGRQVLILKTWVRVPVASQEAAGRSTRKPGTRLTPSRVRFPLAAPRKHNYVLPEVAIRQPSLTWLRPSLTWRQLADHLRGGGSNKGGDYMTKTSEILESKQPLLVDRHDERIINGLKEAPIYRKQGEVRAVIAKGGEVVVTILADGTTETRNTAKPRDAIITNPGGEQYIIGAEKFAKRYEPKEEEEEEEGVFIAKGHSRAIVNPWAVPITMVASWGEMQNGQSDCMIADTYDIETGTLGGEPYIIAPREFNKTYKPVQG